jgi:uncharacterized coiled-coil DUF342 family protein
MMDQIKQRTEMYKKALIDTEAAINQKQGEIDRINNQIRNLEASENQLRGALTELTNLVQIDQQQFPQPIPIPQEQEQKEQPANDQPE